MQGVIATLAQFAITFQHQGDTGSFCRDFDIVKAQIFQYLHMRECGFHHSFTAMPIPGKKLLGQGSAVYPDANGNTLCFGGIAQAFYPFAGADVTGIDAQSVNPVFDGGECQTVIEMNICYQSCVHSPL